MTLATAGPGAIAALPSGEPERRPAADPSIIQERAVSGVQIGQESSGGSQLNVCMIPRDALTGFPFQRKLTVGVATQANAGACVFEGE